MTSSSKDVARIRRAESSRETVLNFIEDLCLDAERRFEPPNHRRDGRVPELPFPFPATVRESFTVSPFPFYRCHLHTGNPARHDAPELGEVGGDVQREAVPRHPLLHVDADAGDLAPSGPHPGIARVALSRDLELGQRFDQGLLQRAKVPVQVGLMTGQVENRITHELAGAVEGHVTAALDLEDVDAVAADEMVRVGVAAQRHHRGVLEQEQQVVRQTAVDTGLRERALPLERFGVWDDAGLHDLEQTRRPDPSPIARPSSPPVAPATDQRLAAVPTTALSTPQAIRPGKPSSRSATAARNPTSNAPTAASTPMTPLCHRFSSGRLRRQPNMPATATPASSPASSGSPAASR